MNNLPKKASDLFININDMKLDTFSDETIPLLDNFNKNYGTSNNIYINLILENIKTGEILKCKYTCNKNKNYLINTDYNNIENINKFLNNLVSYTKEFDYNILCNNKSINFIPDSFYMLTTFSIFTNINSIFKLNSKYYLIKKQDNKWVIIANSNKYLLNIIKNKNKTIKTLTKQNLNFQNEIINNISNNYLIKTTLNNLNNLV